MKARSTSPCSLCERLVEPGDEITGWGDSKKRRRWVHQECATVTAAREDDSGWHPSPEQAEGLMGS